MKRKKSVIKFEQDKTSLNKIWPPQFFFCCMFICNYCESERNTVCLVGFEYKVKVQKILHFI